MSLPIPSNAYLLNYFPASSAIWNTYSGATVSADFTKLKALGFNAVRVQLGAASGEFSFSSPTTTQLNNLKDFYSRLKSAGMTANFTLFDHWGSYGYFAGSQNWATAVLGALPDFTAVNRIELQNEQQFASTASYTGGFDSGWTASQSGVTLGAVEIAWAQMILPYIRTLVPNTTPVVISTRSSTGDAYPNILSGLVAGVAALDNTNAAPDWWEYHCYGATNGARITAYSLITKAIVIVGDPSRIFIGETGFQDSAAAVGTLSVLQQQIQGADWFQSIRWACQQLGLKEPSPWMMYDMPVNSSPNFSTGQWFGLFDTSGNLKPAAQQYLDHPLGAKLPPIDLNPRMKLQISDGNSNILPKRYWLYKGSGGAQAISATVDTTTTYLGNPSIALTGSGGTTTANAPALTIEIGDGWPVYFPDGQTYTLDVALKGSGSTGTTQLGMYWYGLTGYISGGSSTITLTTSWARYQKTASAPVGATMLRLYIPMTAANAGTIWAADPKISGALAPRLISSNGHWYR